jgi:hypothetical protein
MSMRRAVLVLAVLIVSGCSLKADSHRAALKVARFHALLNAGKFDQIAGEADPAMKWAARGPSFRDYLSAIHRKLGFCGSWRMLSYVEQFTPRGRLAELHTDTHCDRDNAQESFVFGPDPDMKIRGYAITSRVLITS